jgi:hypothetical protein
MSKWVEIFDEISGKGLRKPEEKSREQAPASRVVPRDKAHERRHVEFIFERNGSTVQHAAALVEDGLARMVIDSVLATSELTERERPARVVVGLSDVQRRAYHKAMRCVQVRGEARSSPIDAEAATAYRCALR